MATNQKTRPSGTTQSSRSTAKKKKQGLLQSLLGGSSKSAAKSAPQRSAATQRSAQSRQSSAATQRSAQSRQGSAAARSTQTRQTSTATQRSPEEVARRRALAAEQAQRRQAASQEMAVAQEALPEEVFNTAQQNRKERTPEEKKRIAMRKKSAKRTKERAVEAKKAANRPNVTYTQPRPFNLNKLLLQLAVVIAVVLAVVIGLSVFFKVDRVVVYGNDAYSAWTIQEASGIEDGENLLTIGRPRACGKIITALPYVKTARIGIKLPDTVNIYIEEFDVSYAIADANEDWWLITSSGKVAEQIDKAKSNSYTKIEGVQLVGAVVGEQGVAYEVFEPEATDSADATEATEDAPLIIVTANDRLKAALLILESLEANEIVGEVASVNVSSIFNMELRYGQRYQVKLGDTSQMDKKISQMKQSVAQLNDYQTGILDVSYTTWPDGPFYTPLA